VLLAIFILGIGVISVAALFPAGITLQRQSNDDVVGPLVAQNALGILRSKLRQEDFGSFSDFNPSALPYAIAPAGGAAIFTVAGDWPWMRPGFIFDDAATATDEGAIDIFSQQFTRKANGWQPFTSLDMATELPNGWPSSGPQSLWGIPYNPTRFAILQQNQTGVPDSFLPDWLRVRPEPKVIITQRERYWPMEPVSGAGLPQYVWECMFRRFQGRVQVAIFVYRVSFPGGQPRTYSVVPSNPADNAADCPQAANRSPLPTIFAPPSASPTWWVAGAGSPLDASIVPSTATGIDLTKPRWMWQVPGQWILDQNNNVHRVLTGRRNAADGPVRFARPIAQMPAAAVYGARPGVAAGALDVEGVAQAWYMPIRDAAGVQITPVFVMVEEL
jgi:hypothetical protein